MSRLPFLRDFFWVAFLPLSFFWAMLMVARRRYYTAKSRYQAAVPVLCVGNLHSGGSGKTPLVAAIAEYFEVKNPIILSRGYRGQLSAMGARVDPADPKGSLLFGDEPWMLSKVTKSEVYVGKDRRKTLKKIEPLGRPVILDDGFQHLRVLPHCSVILINTAYSLEDSYVLPLGDLREPLSALNEASAVLLVSGADSEGSEEWRHFLGTSFPTLAVYHAKRVSRGVWDSRAEVCLSPGTRLAAFCGIARPEGFEKELKQTAEIDWVARYPDHHSYSETDLNSLLERKRASSAESLVTTDKDWFKVQDWFRRHAEPLLRFRIGYEISPDFWYFLKNHWAS